MKAVAFAYRSRLSAKNRRIYDASDAIVRVELPAPSRCRRDVRAIARHLKGADRIELQRACSRLTREITEQLEVETPIVRVLSARPRWKTAELHGEYIQERGRRPVIRVWMRTAARKQPVAFRTFLRTVLHEIGHHLDFHYFELADSFHTEGFFRRESDLMNQLAPADAKAKARKKKKKPKQLLLVR